MTKINIKPSNSKKSTYNYIRHLTKRKKVKNTEIYEKEEINTTGWEVITPIIIISIVYRYSTETFISESQRGIN